MRLVSHALEDDWRARRSRACAGNARGERSTATYVALIPINGFAAFSTDGKFRHPRKRAAMLANTANILAYMLEHQLLAHFTFL